MTKESPSVFRRVAAFALDYVLIVGYLVILAAAGSALAFGPVGDSWQELVGSPGRVDLLAFVAAILPVILYFTLLEGSQGGATWGKRRMRLRVARTSGERLGRRRASVGSAVKFLPWQLAHTCLFHIPGWPLEPQTPPGWVTVGLDLVWVVIGLYVATLAIGRSRRTPYDWIAGSRVVDVTR
jgi:hypothetical protein